MEGNMKRVFSSERKSTYKFVSEKVPIFQANHEDDGSTLGQEGDLVGGFVMQRQETTSPVGSCMVRASINTMPAMVRITTGLWSSDWKGIHGQYYPDKYWRDCGCEGFISSAIGSISRPTLNHGRSTVSYEGSYVILKVSSHYSFDSNGQVKQNGNLGISFADSKGVAFCGSVAGSLTAATPPSRLW
ncbi:hypothetical protein F0562_024258 [Nyssa sinensis]|uniref:AT-hook motif nuclear-localized protein n=1 Tax=Nyssa sinensis TaxID=561372 RepID=A0A5J5BBU0_9ASTE|nr:hypothetical protein F0562_024258 [Nyssa sinensis]